MPEINYGSFKQKVDEKGRWLINFSAALAAMRRGEKVARAHWGGYWFIPAVNRGNVQLWDNHSNTYTSMKPMIVACLKDDGGYAPAQPYMEDLLAEDWVVIGREEEQKPFSGIGITAATIPSGQVVGIKATPYTAATIFKNGSDQLADIKKRVEELREVVKLQGQDGNWNYAEYHHGMYNAAEFALSIMEGREPVFKDAPEQWIKDKAIEEGRLTLTSLDNAKEPDGDEPAPPEELWQLLDVLRALDPGVDGAFREAIKDKIAKAMNL